MLNREECWAALAGGRAAASEGEIQQACLVLTGRSAQSRRVEEGSSPGLTARPATTFEEVLAIVEDLR